MGLWASREERLHEATRQGDTVTVIQLLEAGVSVNSTVGQRSLLYTAIQCGRYDLAKCLVKRGAHITTGFYTDTPLHLASRMGAEKLVKYLLKCGACVNLADHNNCTPLWGAVAENKMATVQVLLRHPGIDVNQPCSDRFMKQGSANSPLLEAVQSNNLELISLLCIHGADLEQEDSKRHKPLHRASSLGYSDVVNVLISEGSNVNAVDESNVTPLYLACERGYLQIATMLINAGCDVTLSRNLTGWKHKMYSPLHIAVQEGHTDIVRLLCSVGANVDITESLGKTPLILACDTYKLEIMEILLDSSADVNRRDVFGHTPLFYALQSSQRWLKRKFERSSQRLTTGSRDQNLTMQESHDESSFSVRAVKLLLKSGAEMNVTDNWENHTPLYNAIIFGQMDTTCVLLQHGSKLHSTDIQVEHLKWENLSMLKLLLHYSQEFYELAERLSKQKSILVLDPELQILTSSREPDSLTKLCRQRIRKMLQHRTQRSLSPLVENLPVPLTLKRFLLYEDMYELVFHKCHTE